MYSVPNMPPFMVGLALIRAFEMNDIIFGRSPMPHPEGSYSLDDYQPAVRKQASLVAALNRVYSTSEGHGVVYYINILVTNIHLGNYPIDMLDKYGILFYTGLTVIDETTMNALYALGHQRDTACSRMHSMYSMEQRLSRT